MNSISLPERCWSFIGIEGDRTCLQLSTHAHCRNCPVYTAAGRHLLKRTSPEAYRQEWTQLLAESRIASHTSSSTLTTTATLTVVIFRLQQEWLALPASILRETTQKSVIHTIPHRSNSILRGLINIRGELLLCVSLNHLLNLETLETTQPTLSPLAHSRMVVVEKTGDTWVFAVDELYGIHRLQPQELQETSKNTQQSIPKYTNAIFLWQPSSSQTVHTVSYLDDELLFTTLARKTH